MKTQSSLLLILVLFLVFPLLAQAGASNMTVSGTVTDNKGNALSNVSVRVDTLMLDVITTPNGSFKLIIPSDKVAEGNLTRVTANLTGYYPQTRKLTLKAGETASFNFELPTIPADELLTATTTETTAMPVETTTTEPAPIQ